MNQTENSRAVAWALQAGKPGDDRQVGNLANLAPFSVRLIDLEFRDGKTIKSRHDVPDGLTPSALEKLREPYPDIVFSAGRLSRHVGEWIRDRSAHPVKLVHIGAADGPLKGLDLLIAPLQFGIPPRRNVVPITAALAPSCMPPALSAADPSAPLLALCVGGPTDQYRYLSRDAAILAQALNRLVPRGTGHAVICDSRRTPPGFIDLICRHLTISFRCLHWRESTSGDFTAILQQADGFIVTADSISLMTETCLTGRPVAIHRPSPRLSAGFVTKRTIHRILNRISPNEDSQGARLQDWLHSRKIARYPRDLTQIYDHLLGQRCAMSLTDSLKLERSFLSFRPEFDFKTLVDQEAKQVVNRLAQLIESNLHSRAH